MRLRSLIPTLTSALLLQLLTAATLAAQDQRTTAPPRFIPASVVAASAFVPAAPAPLISERTQALQMQLRRGRALIAVGSGLIAGGVAHAAAFGRRNVCSEPSERLVLPPVTGTIVAAAGLGMTINGGLKLARAPAEVRSAHPLTSKGKAGVVLGAIGSALVSSVVLFGITALPWIDCIAS